MKEKDAYALSGVNRAAIKPFKVMIGDVVQRTKDFSLARGMRVWPGEHGTLYQYLGRGRYIGGITQEGLGNKSWIAMWMRKHVGTGLTYNDNVSYCMAMMGVNDVIAQGALPFAINDEVSAGTGEWFEDEACGRDFAEGLFDACQDAKMTLGGGESATLKYLVHSAESAPGVPVPDAPVLSCAVTGIIAPTKRLVSMKKLCTGDRILGVTSSGLHANGISLVNQRALALPDQFLTKVPDTKRTLGEEALIRTRCYVKLVEALLDAEVELHGLLPGTGDGVAKLAAYKRPFTYQIHSWVDVPPLFLFMRELGVSLKDCLTTFNWGVGYYIFVPAREVARAILIGGTVGYKMYEVGRVEKGDRKVIFEPEDGLVLYPPGE
jgi:phosphoribosylformylglycinamidine cyclo-ligase